MLSQRPSGSLLWTMTHLSGIFSWSGIGFSHFQLWENVIYSLLHSLNAIFSFSSNLDWHLFINFRTDSVSEQWKGFAQLEMMSFWENELQRYYYPVGHLKSSVHKFKSSWLHFISVRMPLHVEASGCIIVPEGEQLFQLLNDQFHLCVYMFVYLYVCADMYLWWWWVCDEFDLCFLQPPQTASLAELLWPLWTSVSRRKVRLRTEPRWLQLHHRRWRVSFTAQMFRE